MIYLLVKYFGIIIDHSNKRVIHGESGVIYKIEEFTGLPADIYNTIHGYNTALSKAQEMYSTFPLQNAELVWASLLPLYEARIAELKAKGIHVDRRY
jgi:hypothetical protein